jgi:hypothetical protein
VSENRNIPSFGQIDQRADVVEVAVGQHYCSRP